MTTAWELKEEMDISWWHCGRAGYWQDEDVYCSKCQTKLLLKTEG